jgi:[ribosomal protein S5]-alanine N-acetyltransferase
VRVVTATDRLMLREFTTADAEHFFHLNDDPEVIRYTGDPPFADFQEAREFIAAYDVYALRGYGSWAVSLKTDSAFLGWCGLGYRATVDEVDLGFRFFRSRWGQGFAMEASRAALQLGFTRYRLECIVGRAMPGNTASHRVLLKLGMQPVSEFIHDGHGWVQYELTAAAFLTADADRQRSCPPAPVYNRASDAPDETKDGP